MKNLATINQKDITILDNGDAFVSQRKCAELCGVSQSAVSQRCLSLNLDVKQGISSENAFLLITHYASQSNQQAIQSLIVIGSAGMKAYIYHEAGYVMKAEIPPSEIKKLPVQEFKGLLAVAKMFGLKGNQALISANIATRKNTGVDFQAMLGIELEAPVQSRLVTPTDMGLLIKLSGIKVNQLLKENGYQTDRRDSKGKIIWTPTDKGMKFSTLLDTGKKNGDGTPVQQVKWCESIIKELGL